MSFYTIVGSTRASTIRALLIDTSLFPEKSDGAFAGYATSADARPEGLIHNVSTGVFNAQPLVDAGLLKSANVTDSSNTWQGWTTATIFAVWSSED